ncbi:uncharacterized protein LOC128983572 [Macrosteles quadrilineatus]|uniref:uncharacterized protein LOC128983572 n=1 Tax=Macrosteles quadrilineatus TaxID=74068 RepID=UPI0023E2E5BC|nr:uncharacterized protein LOC128983572 [Macrosteles quadrilineatus]
MQNEESYGGFVPLPKHIDPENNLHRENTEKKFKFTSGKDMLVKCVEDDKEAKAFVFGPEGYFIDRLTLQKTKKENNVCKQLLDNIEMGPIHAYTSTIRSYKFTFSLVYTFHLKNKPQCLSRTYTVEIYLHYPTLERGSEEMTNCKETVIDTSDSKKRILITTGKVRNHGIQPKWCSCGKTCIYHS